MRTTTGNSSILGGLELFGYKFKLMNRNFIQGHPLVEPSPYVLLVSLALLITTLSLYNINPMVQLITVSCILSLGGGDLFFRVLIRLLLVVYIILIHSLQLLGYFNHYYIKY